MRNVWIICRKELGSYFVSPVAYLLLTMVAFCFGALLEGTAGFGAPVAVTAFLLLQLRFTANRAVMLSLIANTTPVAFGALGIPIVALAAVTGLDQGKLSAMVGRQLPFMVFDLPQSGDRPRIQGASVGSRPSVLCECF